MIKRFWNRWHFTTIFCTVLLALLIVTYISMQAVENDCAAKGGKTKWISAGKGISSLCIGHYGRILE